MPSTTAEKLKIKAGDVLLTLHAPAGFKKQLGPLPAGVQILTSGKSCNQIHWFTTNKAQVEKEITKVLALVKEKVICWVYFPKGSSGMQTDLTRDKGWDVLLMQGDALAWLTLVSFDDTWSAFSFRLKTAADKTKPAVLKERLILQYIDASTKTIRLPEDLAAALKKNKPVNDFFQQLAFSHRKEYIEWIVTAKQEATRNNRIAGTMERLQKQWKNPRGI